MKISSIIDIVNGELKNNPAISFITQQHTNVSKVNDGDLFISSSIEDIQLAIQKGAFAIIYDISIDITTLNNEIAFIKVNSIGDSLIKLARFNLIDKNIQCYFTDDISIDIFENIISPKQDIIILNNNIKFNFEMLKGVNIDTIIISSNKAFLFNINPKTSEFELVLLKLKNLIVHSLFETTFSYKETYYYKFKLSYIYINNFINIINFLQKNNIKYDTNKINSVKYMHPIFINKNTNIVDFGKSNQFILSNNIEQTVQNELNFIKKHYNYGTIVIIDGYCSDEILFEKLKNNKSNAIYIINRNQNEIINLLNNNSLEHAKLF